MTVTEGRGHGVESRGPRGVDVAAAEAARESSMMVDGAINGVRVRMLVDTGAAVTLLSECVLSSLGLSWTDPEVMDSEPLVGACGGVLPVIGKVKVQISLGGLECPQLVSVVKGLRHQCLLGRDVLCQLPCSIVMGEGRMVFCTHQGFSVRLCEQTMIPPRHEVVVTALVEQAKGGDLEGMGEQLFNGDNGLWEKKKLLAASAVVTPQQGRVVVRLLNNSLAGVHLPKFARLGEIQSICAVHELSTQSQDDGDPFSDNRWEDHDAGTGLWDVLRIDRSRLTDAQVAEAQKLLERHRSVFAMSSEELGRTHVMQHHVDTGESAPIFQGPRRLPWGKRQEARRLVDKMVGQGVIEPSSSPWSAPIVLVTKKDGSTRFCVDYRRLNAVTKRDPYPLPRIDETLDALGGSAILFNFRLVLWLSSAAVG